MEKRIVGQSGRRAVRAAFLAAGLRIAAPAGACRAPLPLATLRELIGWAQYGERAPAAVNRGASTAAAFAACPAAGRAEPRRGGPAQGKPSGGRRSPRGRTAC